jgi:hypothetical protein
MKVAALALFGIVLATATQAADLRVIGEPRRALVSERLVVDCDCNGLPWGGLRKRYHAGLPWGGLRKTCAPVRPVRGVVLMRKG